MRTLPLVLLSIALILGIGLFPDISMIVPPNSVGEHSLAVGWGKSGDFDVLLNILLFVPLGFSLTGFLTQRARLALPAAVLCVLAVSFGLSYTVEAFQNFIPSRFSSFVDVISNSVGGLLGFLCFRLWVTKNVQLGLLGYIVVAFVISIHLQQATSLGNWDKTFPFLLGNERTEDRPWRGQISEVYIADRAISAREVKEIGSKEKPFAVLGDSLVAWYRLKGGARFQDKMGHLPDLAWKGQPQDIHQVEGVNLGPNQWLETTAPASYLTRRIKKTSQFTLVATVTTGDTEQQRTTRIVSLSANPNRRNFTLAQLGSDLVFRLRTPLTGENGTDPQLVVPNIFSTMDSQNLVITYNGSILNVYVNGERKPQTLELTPGAAAISYFLDLDLSSMRTYKILYYAIIFIPLGILLSLAARMLKLQIPIQILVISGCVLLSSIMLEGILVSVSGRSIKFENLLLSTMFTFVPLVVFRFLRYVKPKTSVIHPEC